VLYNLAADLGETTDVAAANPQVLARIVEISKRAHVDSDLFPLRQKRAAGPAGSPLPGD